MKRIVRVLPGRSVAINGRAYTAGQEITCSTRTADTLAHQGLVVMVKRAARSTRSTRSKRRTPRQSEHVTLLRRRMSTAIALQRAEMER